MITIKTEYNTEYPLSYDVYYENKKHLGYFRLDIDGYYYFEDIPNSGNWSSYALRQIADKLDEINKPYDDKVTEYFEDEKRKNNSR